MKKHLFFLYALQIATVIAVIVAWAGFKNHVPKQHAPESRGCYQKQDGRGPCIVSFSSVQVLPQSFDGKRIILVGYLSLRYGVPMLYATREDYLNDVATSAIAVVGPYEELAPLFKAHGNGYVRLEARVQLADSKRRVAWVGELGPPFQASTPEPPPAQDVDDLLVPVEFMPPPSGQEKRGSAQVF